jgi:hypothetical protein
VERDLTTCSTHAHLIERGAKQRKKKKREREHERYITKYTGAKTARTFASEYATLVSIPVIRLGAVRS